jgi:hypothetical protein
MPTAPDFKKSAETPLIFNGIVEDSVEKDAIFEEERSCEHCGKAFKIGPRIMDQAVIA